MTSPQKADEVAEKEDVDETEASAVDATEIDASVDLADVIETETEIDFLAALAVHVQTGLGAALAMVILAADVSVTESVLSAKEIERAIHTLMDFIDQTQDQMCIRLQREAAPRRFSEAVSVVLKDFRKSKCARTRFLAQISPVKAQSAHFYMRLVT